MIDKDTKEALEIAAYLVTVGEVLVRFGGYIARKAEKVKKRSRYSEKPRQQRKRRKRR